VASQLDLAPESSPRTVLANSFSLTSVIDGSRGATATLALILTGAGVYGAVLGSWHGPRMAAYAALKLPLVFLLTAALTFPFQWTAAAALGVRLRLAQAATLTFGALAAAAAVLMALAPVAALFTFAAPPPGTGARTAHNLLYLTHTLIVGIAGLAGTAALRSGLVRLAGTERRATQILRLWILPFAVVGGEIAWALRPFVGSVFLPPQLLRANALDGNVYEFIWTDIAPHLLRSFLD
jgi:hypothetical protein